MKTHHLSITSKVSRIENVHETIVPPFTIHVWVWNEIQQVAHQPTKSVWKNANIVSPAKVSHISHWKRSRNDRVPYHDLYTSSKSHSKGSTPTDRIGIKDCQHSVTSKSFSYFSLKTSRTDRVPLHDLYTSSRCAFRGSCPSSVKRMHFRSLKAYLATHRAGRLLVPFLTVSPPNIASDIGIVLEAW